MIEMLLSAFVHSLVIMTAPCQTGSQGIWLGVPVFELLVSLVSLVSPFPLVPLAAYNLASSVVQNKVEQADHRCRAES